MLVLNDELAVRSSLKALARAGAFLIVPRNSLARLDSRLLLKALEHSRAKVFHTLFRSHRTVPGPTS